MLLTKLILASFLSFCFSKAVAVAVDVTFKDATFRGYSIYIEQFKKTIPSSNSLREFLPNSVFDKIEFVNQNIPVLRENSLADLGSLDELVIEFCQVADILPGALKNIPQLRKLSLKGNKLERIQEGVFDNLGISTIDLSLNAITMIESGAFNNMPNILHINMADNKIHQWDPKWFKNTPLLNRISMQNNSIAKLPNKAFANLKGLKMFGTTKLTVNIILSYNKIKEMAPKTFDGLKEVNHLWLDNNLIENFDENLLNNVDVKDLRLNDNKIRCLNGDLSKIIKSDTTYLDSNPFDCECFKIIKTWAEKNRKNVEFFFSDMDCTTQRMKNRITALEQRLKENREEDNTFEKLLP